MTPRAVLIGLPGSGKTTTGKRLAGLLEVPFVDSDHLVEEQSARTIESIFATDGEAAFRALEAAAIANALTGFAGVLALGGGAVVTESTREALARSGVPVIWLHSTVRSLARRVGDGRGRPLLAGDARGRLAELSVAREPLYRSVATEIITTDRRTSAKVAAEIVERLGSPTAVRP